MLHFLRNKKTRVLKIITTKKKKKQIYLIVIHLQLMNHLLSHRNQKNRYFDDPPFLQEAEAGKQKTDNK